MNIILYCKLILSIFDEIKNDKILEPFYIEMMLFSITKQKETLDEIKKVYQQFVKENAA